jgi:hypothetical protein
VTPVSLGEAIRLASAAADASQTNT